MMRWISAMVVLLAFHIVFPSPDVVVGAEPEIIVSAKKIPQGGLAVISVEATGDGMPQVTWMGKKVFLVADETRGLWEGFIAVDLRQKPGSYSVIVKSPSSGQERRVRIEIEDKDYGVRRLTLPKEMVDLDSQTLKRVRKEAKTIRALWQAPASEAVWRGAFLKPLDGDVVGPFGRRSIINDQPRAPHSGVDFRAGSGTPVRAMNHGIVVLTEDRFFAGRSVVLDHGGGILSMYFHLEKILVQKDQFVEKGQVVGLVGATGRATGPHLHLGVRINGARVNPLGLMALSKDLE
jgi:murein DD-endopeptidase MepM/ murein hydrolase activator NlpD